MWMAVRGPCVWRCFFASTLCRLKTARCQCKRVSRRIPTFASMLYRLKMLAARRQCKRVSRRIPRRRWYSWPTSYQDGGITGLPATKMYTATTHCLGSIACLARHGNPARAPRLHLHCMVDEACSNRGSQKARRAAAGGPRGRVARAADSMSSWPRTRPCR